MGYKVGWYVPAKVIYVRWSGQVTWELLEAMEGEVMHKLEEGKPLIHVVADFREVTSFPLNFTKAKEVLRVSRHPSLGWTVTVTDNPILRFAATTLPQVMRHTRTTAVASVEEALKYLAERDDTIDWSQTDETVLERDSDSEFR